MSVKIIQKPDLAILDMSTDTVEGFKKSLATAKRLTMFANSYLKTDEGQKLVCYHLDDEDGNEYMAIHDIKSVELVIADYMKAKVKLEF